MKKSRAIIGSGKRILLTSFLLQLSWTGLAINPGMAGAGSKVNRPPSFDGFPPERCVFRIGRPGELALPAVDPDGDSITFRTNRFPEGAFFDPERQVFNWTPKKGQEGYYLGFEVAAIDQAGNSNKIVFNATVIPEAGNKTDGSRISSAGEAEPGGAVSPGGQNPGTSPAKSPPGARGETERNEIKEEKTGPGPEPTVEGAKETVITPSPAPTPEKTPSPYDIGSGGDTARPTASPVLTPEPTPTPILTPEPTPTPETKRDIFVTTAEDEDDPETDPDNPLGTGLSLREAIAIVQSGGTIHFDLPLGESRIELEEALVIARDNIKIAGDRDVTIDAGNVLAGVAFKISGSGNAIQGLEIVDCSYAGIRLDGNASNNIIEDNIFFDFENGVVLKGDNVTYNKITNNDINVGSGADILIIHSGAEGIGIAENQWWPDGAGGKFAGTTGGLYLDDSAFPFDENPDPGFYFTGQADPGTRIAASVGSQGISPPATDIGPDSFVPAHTHTVNNPDDPTLTGTIDLNDLSLRETLAYLAVEEDKIVFDIGTWPSPKLRLDSQLTLTTDHLYITGGTEGIFLAPVQAVGSGPGLLIYNSAIMLENLNLPDAPGPFIWLIPGAKDILIGFGTSLTPEIIEALAGTYLIDANGNLFTENNYATFSVILLNYNLQIWMRFF